MDLVPFIYHEKQDRDGTLLCAQHCLNNLLQQALYSAGDLADLAADLDQQENAELSAGQQNKDSSNADTSGFFSIGVLENALRVFDLELVRWQSEEMKPYHDKPEDQAAFIMNLQQHWLPLRRFAASPDRWYNLNSLLNGPEWLSKIYLGMALNEAEQGGHSVFVLRKIGAKAGDETGLSVLPECQADLMGLQFGSPSAGGRGFSNDDLASSAQRSQSEFERFQQEQMQAFQEQQGNSLRSRSYGTVSAEGSYAHAAQNSTTMNRFQRTRMEEEEDLRKAIEASLADSGEQGTSLASEQVRRTNETVPLVASSNQPVDDTTTTTESLTSPTSPDAQEGQGFVGGLVASIFEPGVNVPLFQAMNASFFLLILSLLFLGYMTRWNKHVLFLMLISTGLWMTMIWFVQELARVQLSQQNAPPNVETVIDPPIEVEESKKDM